MQRIWLVVMVIVGLTTLVFEHIYRHEVHAHYIWHTIPIFDLIYGFVGAIVLVWVSKWLGHTWLQREETYYGDEQL